MPDSTFSLTGRVTRGAGQGATFTRLDWARTGFLDATGIEPYPGTLNLRIDDPGFAARWSTCRNRGGIPIEAGDGTSCDARVFPVTLNGRWYGAVVYPDVAGYADDQVEIISAVCLRELLPAQDGDTVDVEFHGSLSVEALMFDVDGTLLNSLDGYLVAVRRAIEPHGYEVSLDLIRRSLNSTQEFWHLILPKHEHANDDLIGELRNATMGHWPAARDEHVNVLPGVAELIHELRRSPARLGICTGSSGESFPPLERAGLLKLFDAIVTGQHVERRKPDPEGIVRCLEELGVIPANAAYVGDSVVDIMAARAAGVHAIGVLTGAGDSATLTRSGADRIIPAASRLSTLLDF